MVFNVVVKFLCNFVDLRIFCSYGVRVSNTDCTARGHSLSSHLTEGTLEVSSSPSGNDLGSESNL